MDGCDIHFTKETQRNGSVRFTTTAGLDRQTLEIKAGFPLNPRNAKLFAEESRATSRFAVAGLLLHVSSICLRRFVCLISPCFFFF